jgi:hypothetical protein
VATDDDAPVLHFENPEGDHHHYHAYIAWRRLSHNGARKRADLTPEEQAEWDSYGITEGSLDELVGGGVDPDEAKRLYDEATGRS